LESRIKRKVENVSEKLFRNVVDKAEMEKFFEFVVLSKMQVFIDPDDDFNFDYSICKCKC